MKKLFIIFYITLVIQLSLMFAMPLVDDVAAIPGYDIKVNVNGETVQFPDQKPLILNNHTFIPLRFVSEALNCQVSWDESNQTAIINNKKTLIKIFVNKSLLEVNGQAVDLDEPAEFVNGRVMVPIRFISQTLGGEVFWDAKNNTVMISYMNKDATKFDETNIPVTELYSKEQLRWTLAVDAIPKKISNLSYDVLGGISVHNSDCISCVKNNLRVWWGIENREDALGCIERLRESGMREEFDYLTGIVSKLSDEQFKNLLEQYSNNERLVGKLQFVKEHYKEFGDKSLIGWDFCRLADLTGACYMVGYINADEAWKEIIFSANMVQKTFASWDDMANNYLLGRIYWSGEADQARSEASKWLLSHPESPWIQIDWNLSLEPNIPTNTRR
ncbi:MAG TPA: hypothetical protein DEF34_02785 [Desulfotomaculum sp.]|nr:hypothetical protein [Desulfotomaculum sp.]